MIIPTYTSGDWYAVITDGAIALLPSTIGEIKLNQVWDALRENPDLTHSLTVLARGGLVGLPPFALVSVVDGHVRGFLRGDVRLATTSDQGIQEHSATHVATWAEINVADATELVVTVPDDAGRGNRIRMSALSAVVLASSVEVRLRAGVDEVDAPVEPQVQPRFEEPLPSLDGFDMGFFDKVPVSVGAAPEPVVPELSTQPEPVARRALRSELPERPLVPAQAETPTPVTVRAEVPDHTFESEVVPAPPVPMPVFAGGLPQRAAAAVSYAPSEMTVVPVAEPQVLAPMPTDTRSADDIYGNTVLSSSLVEIRRQMTNAAPPAPFTAPPEPRVHKIRMSSGLVIPLDRAVLIGRAPVVSRVAARDLPRLVTVVSPNQDISRTHAQVHTDGEDVLVTDLNSTNGMLLTEPGLPPRRLRSGEPTPLGPDALVDLGDGVTFTVERDR